MNTSEQINEIAAALAKAQGQIQPAAKDKTNPAFRSRYADLTSIWEACRAPLTENGIAVVQMPVDSTEGRVALVTTLLHASGQFISSMVSTRLVKDDPQGVGSALTYLRRYALAAMVGVVADEDDDGNHASGRGASPQAQAKPAKPQASMPVLATQAQRDELRKLTNVLGYGKEEIAAVFTRLHVDPKALTQEGAARMIATMTEWAEEEARSGEPTQPSLSDEYDDIDPPAAKNGALTGVTK